MPGRAHILVAAAAAALALTAAPAGAHPGHSVEEVKVHADARTFAPATVRIIARQGVLWRWEEGLVYPDHSVTADPGQDIRFDSGVRSEGTFLRVFRRPGTYTYHCTVHPSMTGTVEVAPLPAPPAIRRFRVSSGSAPTARFRLNTTGFLAGRIKARRQGAWRTVRSFSRRAQRGRNRVGVPAGALDPGRYRLKITVYDRYDRRDSARGRFRLA